MVLNDNNILYFWDNVSSNKSSFRSDSLCQMNSGEMWWSLKRFFLFMFFSFSRPLSVKSVIGGSITRSKSLRKWLSISVLMSCILIWQKIDDLITLTTSLFPFSVFSSVFHIWIQSVRDLFREISNILIHNILIVILFLSDNKLC